MYRGDAKTRLSEISQININTWKLCYRILSLNAHFRTFTVRTPIMFPITYRKITNAFFHKKVTFCKL